MKKHITIFLKTLQYSLSSGKMLTAVLIIANVLLGLFSTIHVWVLGQIAGTLEITAGTEAHINGYLSACLPYLFGLFFLLLFQKFLFSIIPYERTRLFSQVKKKMTMDYLDAVNRVPPVQQETNDYQFRFGRAVDFINGHFSSSFQSILTLISGFASMMSMLILLGRYSLIFPLVSVVTSLPVVFIRLKQDKKMHAMYKEQYPANQLGIYYLNSLTNKDSLIELQIFGAESLFLDRYQTIAKKNIRQRTQYFINHALHGNLQESLLLMIGNVLLVGYALYLFLNRPESYSICMLSVVISGVMSAQEDVIGFAFNGKYIAEAIMYGEDFWDLISKAQKCAEPEKISDPIHSVELKDVSFHYPNSTVNQLDSINITLHAGETVGIVGENGSGKSTLSKVLMGLYAPCKGEIRVNGTTVPLSGFSFERVRFGFSGLCSL